MPADGRTETTLTAPRRCPWCGHRCHGATCQYCQDLERAERAVWEPPTLADELRQAVKRA